MPLTRLNQFPIVGVGASAGGLEVFTELLAKLPGDTGMGFVLVQHLDPAHSSALPEILGRATAMPVLPVTQDLRVSPNHVYVIPPNAILGISKGVLKLKPRSNQKGPHRSIDLFFESLAQDQGERAIGIVLSGTASDGTRGLESIKAEGGLTFAQDASAKYDSMPRSAIAAGCVDFVLSAAGMARELSRLARHPCLLDGQTASKRSVQSILGHELGKKGALRRNRGSDSTRPGPREEEASVGRSLLLLLKKASGIDFSPYKPSTIQRRLRRRMLLSKQDSMEGYFQLLKDNPEELEALRSDMLINVTSFFRNAAAFEVLKARVFPKLVEQRKRDEPVRIWILGCSTGQEAYSIAMAFTEFCDQINHSPRLQIFATDLNEKLLEIARQGFYTRARVDELSRARLRRFFVEEDGGFRISKSLREVCVFARQDMLSDPPFSRMDLISCRNVLIYIEGALQKRILPNFHYALKPGGFLFLGASESVGAFTDLFEPIDKNQKIFFRKPGSRPSYHLPVTNERHGIHRAGLAGKPEAAPDRPRLENSAQREADRITVNQFAPPSVLVSGDWEILQFRGRTSRYLHPPVGKASLNLLKMAREELLLPLRGVVNEARKQGHPVLRQRVGMVEGGAACSVNLRVIPLRNLREAYFLIFFEENESAAGKRAVTDSKPLETTVPSRPEEESSRFRAVRRELAETPDFLQSIQEQYEAAHEELSTSNAEVQSANEELQSINEELETSKEELESTNEELTTVNEEMASRNVELARVNSDLFNLQSSAKLAIVLLGRDLTIRRFTPEAETEWGLMASDIGRPIAVLRHPLEIQNLELIVQEVIKSVREKGCEVRNRQGRHFFLRVKPYLTIDNKVDGVVLVLVDVTELKRTEAEIRTARTYAEAIIRTTRDPLIILRSDFRVNTASEAFYQWFATTREQTEGRSFFELENGAWKIPRLRSLLQDVARQNSFFKDFEFTHRFRHLGRRTLLLNARKLEHGDGSAPMILLTVEDITARHQAEEQILATKAELESLNATLDSRVRERTASLAQANLDLQNLSRHLTNAHEAERERIGRELHDDIGQTLTALRLFTEQLVRNPNTEALGEVMKLAQAAQEQARDLSRNLHPEIRSDLGLRAALEWRFQEYERHTGIKVSFACPKRSTARLDSKVGITAYRIVQEALTNVARHAKTSEVSVKLRFDHKVHLEIRDYGKGFKPTDRVFLGASGLRGMRERAMLHGGTFKIQSSPGKGTRITVALHRKASGPTSEALAAPVAYWT